MQIQSGAVARLGDKTSRPQQGSNAVNRVVSNEPYFNGLSVTTQRTCNGDLIARFEADTR